MAEFVSLLGALLRIAVIPLGGYLVLRCARRWPWVTACFLLVVVAAGIGTVTLAAHDGYRVRVDTRRMEFHSEIGRWCFAVGGLALILGPPALPLVAVARVRHGAMIGPVGGQWAGALFGYFMACAIWSMVLYSWLTGIVK
jgi:hypothetical protein